jgi:hypothetical protein
VLAVAAAERRGAALGGGAEAVRAREAAGRFAAGGDGCARGGGCGGRGELRRFARGDERCQALQAIYGVGPILACHLLAEIGEASRFHRAEQITRLAGLDPVVEESGETRRRGKLAKAWSAPAFVDS